MELKDNFRERMIALDEIGFIGNPSHKYSEKDEYIYSAFFQAVRQFRKEHQREITTEEIQQLVKNLENNRTPAANERFHASGGVCPQTLLC